MNQELYNLFSIIGLGLTLILAVISLCYLIKYTNETVKLRALAQDQVEAPNKPCLTLATKLRDFRDTIVRQDGAVGSLEIESVDACFVLENIGTGVVLNASYFFRKDSTNHSKRYLPNVKVGQRIQMPEPINVSAYSGECKVVFEYESISGRKYESTVSLNNHVLTRFDFRQQ